MPYTWCDCVKQHVHGDMELKSFVMLKVGNNSGEF